MNAEWMQPAQVTLRNGSHLYRAHERRSSKQPCLLSYIRPWLMYPCSVGTDVLVERVTERLPCRASEAAPEKWIHVQRKQLGKKGRMRGNWRDAAAAASLASSSQDTSQGSHSSSTSLLTAPASASSTRNQSAIANQSLPVPSSSASDTHSVHAPASNHQRHEPATGQDLPGCTDTSIQCGLPQKGSVGTDAGSPSADVAISIPADDCQRPSGNKQQQQQQQPPLEIAGSLQSRPDPQDSGFRSRISGFLRQAISFGPAVKH